MALHFDKFAESLVLVLCHVCLELGTSQRKADSVMTSLAPAVWPSDFEHLEANS